MRPDFGLTMDTFFGKFQSARAIIRTPKLLEHAEYWSFEILLNQKRRKGYSSPPRKPGHIKVEVINVLQSKLKSPLLAIQARSRFKPIATCASDCQASGTEAVCSLGSWVDLFWAGFFLGGTFPCGFSSWTTRRATIFNPTGISICHWLCSDCTWTLNDEWVCLDKV